MWEWRKGLFNGLTVCLLFLFSGCVGLTVKHVNPDEPNLLESNEKVVFGRIVFMTHSEEMGEMRFVPVGLGLVHVETGKRAQRAVVYEKAVANTPFSGETATQGLISSRRMWFENDGAFFWVLPVGNYRMDALGWGLFNHVEVSREDLEKPKKERSFPVKPQNPPECGFVVGTDIEFSLYGDSAASYIGSLVIDMGVKTEHVVEIRKINRIEVNDEYAEAMELLKSRYPSFNLAVGKKLATVIPESPVSVSNRRCPTRAELVLRAVMAVAIQFGPSFIPIGPGIGSAMSVPSLGMGR